MPPVLFKEVFSRPSFGLFAFTLDIPRVSFLLQGANDIAHGRDFFQWGTPSEAIETGFICFQEIESRFNKKYEVVHRAFNEDGSAMLLKTFFNPYIHDSDAVISNVNSFISKNRDLQVIFIEGLHSVRHGEHLAKIWDSLRQIAERENLCIICDYQSYGYYDYNVADPKNCLRIPLSHTGIFHPDDLVYASMPDWIFGLLQVPLDIYTSITRNEDVNRSNDCLIGKFLSSEINIPKDLHYYEVTPFKIFKPYIKK